MQDVTETLKSTTTIEIVSVTIYKDVNINIKCWADFRVPEVLHNSCNMCTRALPDMYTQIPRAAGPRDEGVHNRQNIRAHCV